MWLFFRKGEQSVSDERHLKAFCFENAIGSEAVFGLTIRLFIWQRSSDFHCDKVRLIEDTKKFFGVVNEKL